MSPLIYENNNWVYKSTEISTFKKIKNATLGFNELLRFIIRFYFLKNSEDYCFKRLVTGIEGGYLNWMVASRISNKLNNKNKNQENIYIWT